MNKSRTPNQTKVITKMVSLLGVLLLLIPLQGCKFKDLDLRLFVVALGIDRSVEHPEKVSVTAKIAIPLGDPKQFDEKTQYLTEESVTIAEALRKMKSRLDKELDFGHCKVVLLGESFAREDIRQAADWLARRRDIQLLVFTAVARPSANEVLHVQPVSERLSGNSLLLALSKDGTESPFIVGPTFSYELGRRMQEIGLDPIMPLAETKGKDGLDIDKAYIFDKQKAVLALNTDETRIYNILKEHNLITSLDLKFKGNQTAYSFSRSHSSFSIKEKADGRPYIRYKIKIQASIEEDERNTIITEAVLKEMSAAAEQQLNTQVKSVLEKIQKSGTDPLGWGLRYRARHWGSLEAEKRAWEDMYAQLDFEVETRINMKYTGMIR
ncbi:Ger(x)C family spore germination protein [Paenibacillus physcomitrellae]|uniref:Spore germination protein B3 n=1 Tax=Paenibacillus physcomitrellae TaxID=1619311 RepID=A0ABQ1FST1_9BACL|nr:Ger(x)C family spore germination protein [Paenibacillus physcomitrellae]GGA29645.1 spore germination protein B3 [Paenibacillus physcomitrellae]